MRALVATLVGAWVLTACVEGAVPVAPGWKAPAPVPPPEEPGTKPPAETPPGPSLPPLVGQAQVSFEPAGSRDLASIREVHVDLALSGVRGQGALDVEFIAPGAMPYEKRTQVVKALPAERRSLRFTLPVAGTLITSSSLDGPWEVRFFLDGAPLTVAAFTLEP
jgi:hypothetical protein